MIQTDLIERASDVVKNIEEVLEIFFCVICAENVKEARMCPSCSHVYCLDCFQRSLQKCNEVCPNCRVPLRAEQLVHLRWADKIVEALNGAKALLHDVECIEPTLNQSQVSTSKLSEMEDTLTEKLDELSATLTNHQVSTRQFSEMEDRLTKKWDELSATLTNHQTPTRPTSNEISHPNASSGSRLQVSCMHPASRCSPSLVAEKEWHVWFIQWSRIHSDLFYAAFSGGFGLFTIQPAIHPGCIFQTQGGVWTVDVHNTKPDFICVSMRDSSKGVALYQLRTGQLPAYDLSTVDGRKLFREQFVASTSDFSFQLVWEVALSGPDISVFWLNSVELIALTKKQLVLLKSTDISAEPKVEELTKLDQDDYFHCMSMQGDPDISTFHLGAQIPSKERTLNQSNSKLAVGTKKGCIKVFSLFPKFHLNWSWSNAHSACIRSIQWNPIAPEVLASGSDDKQIKLWMPGVCEPLLSLKFGSSASRLQWSPFSATVMAVFTYYDQAFHLFDLSIKKGKPVQLIPKNDLGVRLCLALSPFRPWLIVGHKGGKGLEYFELRFCVPIEQQHRRTGSSSLTVTELGEEDRRLRRILNI